MGKSISKDLKEALFQLNKLKKERPALQGPADLFLDLLPQLFDGESHDQPPPLTAEHAQTKLADRVPLLRGEPVTVDLKAFLRRWLQTAAAVERHRDAQAGKDLSN